MPTYHLLSLLSVWSFILWYASKKQSQKRKELPEIVFQLMGKNQRKSLFVLSNKWWSLSIDIKCTIIINKTSERPIYQKSAVCVNLVTLASKLS